MKTKICSKCGKEKTVDNFKKAKDQSSGLYPSCKDCVLKLRRTKHSVKLATYSLQKRNSKSRGHKPPSYSKEELYEWMSSSREWNSQYDKWEQSGYKKDEAPSVDRVDDNKGYSFDNIQAMSWLENKLKGEKDRRKKINQYSINGEYIRTFSGVLEAERTYSKNTGNISKALKGERKTAFGFKWDYE